MLWFGVENGLLVVSLVDWSGCGESGERQDGGCGQKHRVCGV